MTTPRLEQIQAEQFRKLIIRPALAAVGLWSRDAEILVLTTGIAESGLDFVRQIAGDGTEGRARGFFQMEPATHDDIWQHWIPSVDDLALRLEHLRSDYDRQRGADAMVTNALYAAAMCRCYYRRQPTALPAWDDLQALATYWKIEYNTHKGAGTVDGFMRKVTAHAGYLFEPGFQP